MIIKKTDYSYISQQYPHITREQFDRIELLYYGINDAKRSSFPDSRHHIECIFSVPDVSPIPLLTFLHPDSPYEISHVTGQRLITRQGKRIGMITEYEERVMDARVTDPWYFYVQESNGDLVLKLNPQQLCVFFTDRSQKPCEFCFRADTVGRFKNIKAAELIRQFTESEKQKNGFATLRTIDELSIITGTYTSEEEYLSEMDVLIRGVTTLVKRPIRVVVGTHEAKGRDSLTRLKKSGATCFAFSIEALGDEFRQKSMRNHKGSRSISSLIDDIRDAVELFGHDGTIVRLVVGLEPMTDRTASIIKEIALYNPYWNLNIYMPFTHYHWEQFRRNRPYTLDDIYQFVNTFNSVFSQSRQIRFKISP